MDHGDFPPPQIPMHRGGMSKRLKEWGKPCKMTEFFPFSQRLLSQDGADCQDALLHSVAAGEKVLSPAIRGAQLFLEGEGSGSQAFSASNSLAQYKLRLANASEE